MALKRIQHNLNEMIKEPLPNMSASPHDEDPYHLRATINGPEDSPYSGGVFFLDFYFPMDFPFKPPVFTFITNIYHPSVDYNGRLWMSVLGDEWHPYLTV